MEEHTGDQGACKFELLDLIDQSPHDYKEEESKPPYLREGG
jgi:hypothetical protein